MLKTITLTILCLAADIVILWLVVAIIVSLMAKLLDILANRR